MLVLTEEYKYEEMNDGEKVRISSPLSLIIIR